MMIRLGSFALDSATKLRGMVTHLIVNMDGTKEFVFQPEGLNPENGEPIKPLLLVPARLKPEEDYIADPVLPIEILGTEVKDTASGFTGIAINLVFYQNGCVHVTVQAAGLHGKTGATIRPLEFDIRRLSGERVPDMTPEALERSRVEKPSPEDPAPQHQHHELSVGGLLLE